MTKIVLYIWLMSPTGHFDKTVITGFKDMGECETAMASFVETNPTDRFQPQMALRCVELPHE